jgi:hypothetical protein
MAAMNRQLSQRSQHVVYDATAGQDLHSYVDLAGRAHRVWSEDVASLQRKTELVATKQLAGIAAWRSGFEPPEVWPALHAQLSAAGQPGSSQAGPDGGGTIVLTGDFDADGADEILLYGPGDRPDIRYEPTADELGEFTPTAVNVIGRYDPLVGDFDGNGFDDILWYAAGPAQDYYWFHHADGHDSVRTRIIGRYDPLVGDFDGNGFDDVLWYAAGTAKDYYWRHDGRGYVSSPTSIRGTYTPLVGDLDGDLQADIYWYAQGSGSDHLWYHASGGHRSVRTDNPANGRGGTGDFDADDRDEIVWFTDRGVEPARVWTDTGGQIDEIQATVL